MIKLSLLLFILSMGVFSLKAQIENVHLENWDKIIIQDSYDGWNSYNNILQIHKTSLTLTTLEKLDSIIKKVQPNLIEELLNSLNTPELFKKDPLLIFGRDSLWLIDNAEQLWKEYRGDKKTTKEIDSIAINSTKDYKNVKKIIWSLKGIHWTDDYPYTRISIIVGQDTTSITSGGQYPYMMPWKVNNRVIYNHNLARIIEDILPDNIESNKSRLLGLSFNNQLIDKIYRRFVQEKERGIINFGLCIAFPRDCQNNILCLTFIPSLSFYIIHLFPVLCPPSI